MNLLIVLAICILQLLINFSILAQELDFFHTRIMFQKVEVHYFNNDYNSAIKLLNKLQKIEPKNPLINYYLGVCYLNVPAPKSIPVKYLMAACNGNQAQDVVFDASQTYSNTQLLLGGVSDFPEGIITSKINNKKNTNTAMVSQEGHAAFQLSQSAAENAIFLSGNGKALVYVERNNSETHVWYTRNDSSYWLTPKEITSSLIILGDFYPSSISHDGNRIYLTKFDSFDSDIYVSRLVSNKWSMSSSMGMQLNTTSFESHACESPNGQVLYFASNRPGTLGAMDIYYSQLDQHKVWGIPQNIGSPINSKLSEDYPYSINDGRTLYFSSQSHKTRGGYDIFVSDLRMSVQWTEPVNLGFPINTDEDDFIFTSLTNETKALLYYYSNFRKYKNADTTVLNIINNKRMNIKGSLDLQDKDVNLNDYKIKIRNVLDINSTEDAIIDQTKYSYTINVAKGSYFIEFIKKNQLVKKDLIIIPTIYTDMQVKLKNNFNLNEPK